MFRENKSQAGRISFVFMLWGCSAKKYFSILPMVVECKMFFIDENREGNR